MTMADVAELQPPRWEQIEDRVAALSGLLNAVTAELTDAVSDMLQSEAWCAPGYRSPEHWVALHCGLARGRARQLVVAARRLPDLPVTAAVFRAGEISPDQTAVICRRAPAERDAEVAGLARHATVDQLTRMLACVPPPPPAEPDPPEPERGLGPDDAGVVTFFYNDQGRFISHIDLPADEGMIFEKAITAARSDLFGDKRPGLTWADGLLRLSLAALDNLDPSTARGGKPSERYQVMVHIDNRTRAAQPHLAEWLPPALSSYLACDATMRLAIHDAVDTAADRLLGITPTAPTVDPKLRAAIEHRDRGCRFPGCGAKRWLHIHHIIHREHEGTTIPANLVALCRYHHRQHHLGHIRVHGDPETPGGLHFTDKWGDEIRAVPPKPPPRAKPLHEAAADLDVADGANWKHPWGLPLEARMFAWTPRDH